MCRESENVCPQPKSIGAEPLPHTPSLRGQRSNPECLPGKTLDCFVARAPRNDEGKRPPRHPVMLWRAGDSNTKDESLAKAASGKQTETNRNKTRYASPGRKL